MKLEFHPEAEQEFLEALSHYEARLPGLGRRLDADVRMAVKLLLDYPEIGTPVEAGLRKLVLNTFPYYFIYSITGDVIHVLALAHEKRAPGYWSPRTG